jgi:sugar/nucleoside kinase (ribokinase family)
VRGKRARLLCIGDLALDIVVRTPAAAGVEEGTDVPGTIRFRAGGSAANTCRAFAGLGGMATFVGAVGSDALARRLVAATRADGVTVRAVTRPGPTARLMVILGPTGERSFVTDRGVADALRPADLKPAWLQRIEVLHLPAYSLLAKPLSDAAVRAASSAHNAGALVSVDLASRRPLLTAGVSRARQQIAEVKPDIIFGNQAEAAALAGRQSLRRIVDLAPIVVIKEGVAGCHVLWRVDAPTEVLEIEVATKPVSTTDTTGAGDAFDAGYLHWLVANDHGPDSPRQAAVLRRAALAGHRAAARLLTSARPELVL